MVGRIGQFVNKSIGRAEVCPGIAVFIFFRRIYRFRFMCYPPEPIRLISREARVTMRCQRYSPKDIGSSYRNLEILIAGRPGNQV